MDNSNQPPQPKPMDIHPPAHPQPDPMADQVPPASQSELPEASVADQTQSNPQPTTVDRSTSGTPRNNRRQSNSFTKTFRTSAKSPVKDQPRHASRPATQQPPQRAPSPEPQPIDSSPTRPEPPKKSRLWLKIIINLILIVVAAVVAVSIMFVLALRPVNSSDKTAHQIEVVAGSTPGQIADTLEENGVIRQSQAFNIYTRLLGTHNSLQAGHYSFTPSQSTPEIADALVKGPESQDFSITFLPGATLADHKKVLTEAGFSEAEVDEAFAADYDHLLLADRPESADLEGYIFGETHRFTQGTSVGEILERYFDDYYRVIEDNNLVKAYADHDLTLYEGITLASIIQKEVSGEGDSRQVSQVFHKRLAEDMPLGADATFVYAAEKDGQTPRVDYPSPYNTRIHGGLPPGPISTPGVEALQAAANPAEGDYLYFVSGDDGANHFSRTEEEHIRKTRQYCQENCALF